MLKEEEFFDAIDATLDKLEKDQEMVPSFVLNFYHFGFNPHNCLVFFSVFNLFVLFQ